jgi:phosphonate transport system substrate-binding protein
MPEREYIVQTRLVRETDCPPQTTPPADQAATTTPPSPTPTTPPPLIRVLPNPAAVVDVTAQRRVAGRLKSLLVEYTGAHIEIVVADTEAAAVETICGGDADVAWLSVPGYVVAHDGCGAEAVFTVVRSGSTAQRAQIMVQEDGLRQARGLAAIRRLSDLDGSLFGYTDALSMTGHLAPKAMLVKGGVTPREELYLGGDAQAVLAVYRGEVDAAAGTWSPPRDDGTLADSRAALLSVMPQAARNVKILALSEPIPYEPVVFRADLPLATKERLLLGLMALARSQDGRDVLARMGGFTGLMPASDRDYDVVRRMGETMRLDFRRLLEQRSLY